MSSNRDIDNLIELPDGEAYFRQDPRRFLTVSANIEKVFGMRAAGVANCSKKVSPAGSRKTVKFRKSHLFSSW